MKTTVYKKMISQILPNLQEGDSLAWRGSSMLAKIIRWADNNSYYNHVDGIVYKDPSLRYWRVIRSWNGGVEDISLYQALESYDKEGNDVCIIRPSCKTEQIKKRISWLKEKVGNNKGYDHKLLLLHLLWLKGNKFLSKFGLSLSEVFLYKFDNKNKYVCSELYQWSCVEVGLEEFKKDKLMTPQNAVDVTKINGKTLCDTKFKLRKI